MIVEGELSTCCHKELQRGYFASGVYCDKCMECYEEYYVGMGGITHEQIAADIAHRELVGQTFAEHARFKIALEHIRDECGKVCEEFELCTHVACQSSVDAWFTADKALNPKTYENDEVKDDHNEGSDEAE